MKIVTDSAADLTAEDILAHDISVVPLYIQFPEGEKRAGEISPDAFYDRLEAMRPNVPTTGQPSPEDFATLYRPNYDAGQETLSIHISSGLSGTANTARVGAAQVEEGSIHVVDSLTLSGGLRYQVLAAARAIDAGLPTADILALLDRVRTSTEVIFTLDTLEYLARGGRIGRVQALAGSVLNIRPIINVSKADGKYNTVGRSRTINRALSDIIAHLASVFGDKEPLWVSVIHGRFEEKASQLTQLAEAGLPVAKLELLRISPVLGVHTGPGVVGIAAMPMRLFDEI